MKTKNEIERLAEETLKSIDHIQQVEANNFLFTRIESQMTADNYQPGFAAIKYLSRLSIALVLFIGLNTLTYYFLSDKVTEPVVKQKSTAAEALATEYNLSTNQYSY